MYVTFRCPSCREVMRAPDKLVGENVLCPSCGVEQVVPQVLIPVAQPAMAAPPSPMVVVDTPSLTDRPRARHRSNDPFPVGTVAAMAVALVLVIALVLVVSREESPRGAGADFVATATSVATGLAVIGLLLFLYLIPTFIAHRRRHPNAASITALNILLGWAFVGWVAALVWALTEVRSRDHHHFHNGPG